MKNRKEMLVSLEIESTFSVLENYYKITSKLISDECSVKANNSDSPLVTVINHFYYELPLTVYYPYSFLIILYANVEACFKRLCNYLTYNRDLPFSIDKLSGSLSEKVKNYFQAFKIAGMEQNEISELTKFNRIRNVLVHDNGIVSEGKTEIKKIISNEKGLSVDSHSKQIEIKLFYCENKLNYFKLMFQNILSQNKFKPLFPINE